jgi:hypothetical protein
MANPSKPSFADGLKALLKGADHEDLVGYFASKAKLETTEDLIPPPKVRNVDAESAVPKLQSGVVEDASRKPEEKKEISSLNATTGSVPSAASDMLSPYASMSILYLSRRTPSTYIPSSLMMYYIVHLINDVCTDSRVFRRSCPDYHPYVFRLYCGILFWVQCLRVTAYTAMIPGAWHQFLSRFLEVHPLESLPIPGPLVLLFKTLCASQPEIKEYGPVCPTLPARAGPTRRDSFIRDEADAFVLPNVPGILALLADLNSKINAAQPVYPTKYSHEPVGAEAVTFGFHQFAAHAERTDKDKWSLNSAGLEYPCEADKKLHEVFAERYATFSFPTLAAADDITSVSGFLSMQNRTDWFGRVKDVAVHVAAAYKGSGTLADCAVSGINSNQYSIVYADTAAALPPPTKIADPLSRFPFAFKAQTSVRSSSQMTLAHACLAQTNIVMPANHPHLANFGHLTDTRAGHFWSLAPLESSETNEESFVSLRTLIRGLFDCKF